MEVYFKELISEEASLDKLVDDLERLVQGVDDYARAIGVDLAENVGGEVAGRLRRLKETCGRINSQIASKARATDKIVRQNPYAFVGAAALVGMVVGATIALRRERYSGCRK